MFCLELSAEYLNDWDSFPDLSRALSCQIEETYLASRARAITPATTGLDADVPTKFSVQWLLIAVVG